MVLDFIVRFFRSFSKLEVGFIFGELLIFFLLLLCVQNSKWGRRLRDEFNQRISCWIGVGWTFFCTFQYIFLGPYSALGHSDERTDGVNWIYYLSRFFPGGSYDHSWAGGVDATGNLIFGTQYISLERFLFGYLPLTIALFIMKAGAIGISFAGGYRIARSLKLSREKSTVIGMLAGTGNMFIMGWAACAHGFGFALIYWSYYIIILRRNEKHYFRWVLILAGVYSATTSIIYSIPGLFVAVTVGAFTISNRSQTEHALRSALKIITAFALILGVCLANWIDVIFTIVQLGAESSRGNAAPDLEPLVVYFATLIRSQGDVLIIPVGFAALGILAYRREIVFWRASLCYLVAIFAGSVLERIPWAKVGIIQLEAYRWALASNGYPLVILLIVIFAIQNQKWNAGSGVKRPSASALYFAGFAVIGAAWHHADDFDRYLFFGGQALMTEARFLRDGNWRPKEDLFRVVTIPTTFSPNMLTSYGLDTFDGISSNFTIRQDRYFGYAVSRSPIVQKNKSNEWIRLGPGENLLGKDWNIDALRIANVRFVISDRELKDPNLKLAQAIKPPGVFGAPKWLENFVTGWAPNIVGGSYFIYEIPDAWPRFYFASKFRVSQFDDTDLRFFQDLLSGGGEPSALLSRADSTEVLNQEVTGKCRLKNGKKVPGGFDLDSEIVFEPQGKNTTELLVVNVPFSRFWTGRIGGEKTRLFPVNGAQIGMLVKQCGGPITLRYERPTIAQRFF